jgi:hypothetical protein
MPYGCGAYVIFQPDVPGVSTSPVWTISRNQQITFTSMSTEKQGPSTVGALPLDAPARIAPGSYDLAGVVEVISDVSSAVPSPVPYPLVPTCLGSMTVVARTSVTIEAKFVAGGGCTISVDTGPEPPELSGGFQGVVPAEAMTVSAQNGTNLYVNLFVNDVYVTTFAPGDCLGCRGDDGISAGVLPPLPWQAEIRTQSGRVLVALPVHAGDVIQTDSSRKGDANRIDLSCGRIDIWSGPPLLGPAPGPGTPGDCRP